MSTPIALEILLGFGVPIAWGLWELHTLRCEKKKDLEKARVQAAAQAALTPAAASGTAATPEPTAR
jgi:hypothetical protein